MVAAVIMSFVVVKLCSIFVVLTLTNLDAVTVAAESLPIGCGTLAMKSAAPKVAKAASKTAGQSLRPLMQSFFNTLQVVNSSNTFTVPEFRVIHTTFGRNVLDITHTLANDEVVRESFRKVHRQYRKFSAQQQHPRLDLYPRNSSNMHEAPSIGYAQYKWMEVGTLFIPTARRAVGVPDGICVDLLGWSGGIPSVSRFKDGYGVRDRFTGVTVETKVNTKSGPRMMASLLDNNRLAGLIDIRSSDPVQFELFKDELVSRLEASRPNARVGLIRQEVASKYNVSVGFQDSYDSGTCTLDKYRNMSVGQLRAAVNRSLAPGRFQLTQYQQFSQDHVESAFDVFQHLSTKQGAKVKSWGDVCSNKINFAGLAARP